MVLVSVVELKSLMNKGASTVYWIRNKDHTDIFSQGYVGVSKNLQKRLVNHKESFMRFLEGKEKRQKILHHAMKKYGIENLIVEVICIGSQDYVLDVENKLRPRGSTGWNIAPGGGKIRDTSIPLSDETRKKMSQCKIGVHAGPKNPMYGKTHSAEARKLISDKLKANKTRDNVFKNGKDHPGFICLWVTPNGEFESLREAAKFYNLDKKTISMRCRSKSGRFDDWYCKELIGGQ